VVSTGVAGLISSGLDCLLDVAQAERERVTTRLGREMRVNMMTSVRSWPQRPLPAKAYSEE
jgi:hypothetical protein